MSECIVIGGGVIGLMTARELFNHGVDVLLLERGLLGGESSWAGGGIISPLYAWRYHDSVNRLAKHSQSLYPQLARQLQDESGIDCELLNSGLMITDPDEVERALAWADNWGVNASVLAGRRQITEVEPAVSAEFDQALWLPDIKQIRNPKIVQALRGSFERLGIKYREQCRVKDIGIVDGRVTGVVLENEFLQTERIIIAGGAWSAGLVKAVQHVDVEPVKGQMIMFNGEPNRIHRIVLSNGHYIIPRRDGRVLAGSTLEKTGFDKSITDSALEALRDDAISIIPALAECAIERQWAGLRPGTSNGIPYICAVDEVEGLYLHAGHYRNGIVLGPASVQLMVEIVKGKTPFCDATPYSMAAIH